MAERLHDVLVSNIDNLEIGLPDVFGSLSDYNTEAARFWNAYMGMHRGEIIHLLDLHRVYLNTNMTRFWTGYKNKEVVSDIILLYKTIWKDRDIVFIEGEYTRMGVGNDLFADSLSIQRILYPAESAWERYDEILKTVLALNFNRNVLFILALGPTATVLAYDLTKAGYQALDLGHLDVQYEYSLKNAKGKIAIEGKYVNENVAGHQVSDDIVDESYKNSVVAKIV